MSVKMCSEPHPTHEGKACWKRRHDDDEQHMTVLGSKDGKPEKTYWGGKR